MITGSEMYWLTRLDGIKGLLAGFGIAIMVTAGFVLMFSPIIALEFDRCDLPNRAWKWLFGSIAGSIAFGALLLTGNVFIPTTKEYAAIKVIPMIATENVQEDAGELYGLSVEWMKSQLSKGTHNHGEK